MKKKTIFYLIPLTLTLVACVESSNVKTSHVETSHVETSHVETSNVKPPQSPTYKSTQKTAETTAPPILQIDPGGHKALILDVAFTPDGRYLVSAGQDKVIRVWDIETGETVRMFRGQIGAGSEGKIYAMALSPDGRWLAVGGLLAGIREEKTAIRLYNFASGQLVALLKGHTNVVLSLAFSPDSRFLVSGSSDSNARLWDLASKVSALGGAKATVLNAKHTLTGHTDDIYAVAFTPDSQRVVTGSDDHTLRLWQVADGKLLATLTGHTDKVYSVAISPQDGTIASGSLDYTIRLWEGQTGRLIKTLANQGTQVGSLSFSPDGRYLISGVGSAPHHCHVWSIPDGQEIVTYRGHDNVVIATAISPDGRWVATGGGNHQEIHLWSLREGQLKQRFRGVGASTWAVGFSADGRELAWGNTSDYQKANHRGPLEYYLALPKANALDANALVPRQLTKEGQRFLRAQEVHGDWTLSHRAGGHYGYQDAIIDIRHHNRTVASIERGSTDGDAHRSYTFTPNGQRIISGGNYGILTAYNREGKKLGDYVGHTGDVWAVAVSPDGQLLVSGSADQTVRLWNVDSRENLLTLFHGNNGEWVAWTPTGHYTASPNGDEMVGWHINRGVDRAADYVKAAQLREYFYRPDIVANAIRWRDVSRAVAHAGGTPFQLAQLNVTKAPDFNIIAPPNHSTTRRAQLEVKLSFVDTGEPLDTLQAYVNGGLIDNLKKWALPQRRNSFEKTVTLPLRPGTNQIKIIAKNRLNLISEQTLQVKLVNPAAEQAGTLYLVAVGVSRYQDQARNLRFAATDAQAFHQLMLAQQGKRYRQVKHRLLADDTTRPTAANIKQALELFQQAEPQDTVVLFLSGHGDYDG
jgi:WD40 repeat protein